ncbi:MAG TPA: CBS domain-containing protein [Ramlibacter sp.]|nr:CBS domain-containing protein [Ramlibacter sp.]
MTIASLCKRPLISIDASSSPRTAANLMRDNHVGSLVVMSSGDRPHPIGVVTDRDLAIEVMARGLDPDRVNISRFARGALIEIHASASVQQALEAMERGGVRRVLVIDAHGKPIGIVSTDDLVKCISEELRALSTTLARGMARETLERTPVAPPPVKGAFGIPAGLAALQ